MDPCEKWKSYMAVSNLRIAPFIEVEMLSTGQVENLSRTEKIRTLNIEAKETHNYLSNDTEDHHMVCTLISSNTYRLFCHLSKGYRRSQDAHGNTG